MVQPMNNMDTGTGLFEQIPANLFSVLAGPLKEMHADLLFLVYEQLRNTIYTLSRETVIDLFCEYLETAETPEEWPEEEEEEEYGPVTSTRERASQLLRRFMETGWVLQEQHYDYTLKISLPDYALFLLETLDKIRTGYRMEFRGRVLSVYQNLTGEESMSYVALQQAREDTAELIRGLTSLNHNIKKYTEKLLEVKDPHEVISQIFDEYQVRVLGEQYYRLKTSEHISKYRTGILSRVNEWKANRTEIVSQAARMVEEKQVEERVEGENLLYDWLEFIEESFGSMDEILEEIDRRNTQYARSAVEKLRFQLQQGRGMEQQMVELLRYLAEKARREGEQEQPPGEVARLIRVFRQRAVDELSIKMPAREKKEHEPRPLEVVEINREIRKSKLKRFRRRVQEEITIQEINRYVDSLLKDKSELPLGEVPLETRDHWVKLIYILLYSRSPRAEYKLTGQRGSIVSLRQGRVELPDLTLGKREKRGEREEREERNNRA